MMHKVEDKAPPSGKGVDLARRLITAAVIVPPFLLVIRFGPPTAVLIVVAAAAILGLYEFYQLTIPQGRLGEKIFAIFLGAILCSIFPSTNAEVILLLLAVIVLLLFFGYLVISGELTLMPQRIGIAILGIIYIPFLLSHITAINRLPQGNLWVLMLVSTVWIGDTFALAIGSWIGRCRLSPRISPNKTVEGFFACFLGAIITVMICKYWFLRDLIISDAIMAAVGIALFGQLGDLSESMIKRGARVKDSGALIPGHGGMLDRLDSFLFAAPFLYYFLLYRVFTGGP